MLEKQNDCATGVPESQSRRKAIKKIAVGVGVLAGYSVLPEKWTRPIIGQIVLPAHAETSSVSAIADAAETSDVSAKADDFDTSEEYSLRNFEGNDKQFTWLPQTGADYGGPIKFVFGGDCGELHVPDASVTHGADGNSSNHNQAFYFCGTDFPAGSSENNANRASVFAPPGCNAGSVTLYYNK